MGYLRVCSAGSGLDMSQDEEFWEKLRTEAANYNIPSSEDDKAGIKKIQPFLSQGDKYTGIYIYNLKEGTYVAGKFLSVLNNAAFSTFLIWVISLPVEKVRRHMSSR